MLNIHWSIKLSDGELHNNACMVPLSEVIKGSLLKAMRRGNKTQKHVNSTTKTYAKSTLKCCYRSLQKSAVTESEQSHKLCALSCVKIYIDTWKRSVLLDCSYV